MTEQQMVELFRIGRDIDYRSPKYGKIMKARLTGSWWDMRTGIPTYGANVCVTFEHDKIRHAQWVNQKNFKTDFPNTEIPNEVA